MKRVLCGILYSGEPQLADCIWSIDQQEKLITNYFIIADKPNKEAHDLLYAKFSEQGLDYDYCIKVDADMVLIEPLILSKTIEHLERYSDVSHFIVGVFDYFTEVVIHGMHFFKSGHRYKTSKDSLFVDYVNVDNTLSLVQSLPFVAFHSFNPTPEQAFHFGIHKASKVIQGKKIEFDQRASLSHFRKIRGMTKVFLLCYKFPHFCSLLGSFRVAIGHLDERAIEYSYFRGEAIFSKFCFLRNFWELVQFLRFLLLIIFNRQQIIIKEAKLR